MANRLEVDQTEKLAAEENDVPGNGGGIQSVEIGMAILGTLARMEGARSLAAIARECGMSRAKVYKYLVSFGRTGYVEREPGSNNYMLGAQTLRVGLAALAQVDFVKIASAALPQLSEETGQTVFVSIWGEHGATIVRWEENGRSIALNVRVGSTLPLLNTATGQLFGAFLPPDKTRSFLEQEIAAGLGKPFGVDSFETAERFFSDVRSIGLGVAHSNFLPGTEALAAPVFDQYNRLAGTITALGLGALFDASETGPIATALRRMGERLTERLGGNNDPLSP